MHLIYQCAINFHRVHNMTILCFVCFKINNWVCGVYMLLYIVRTEVDIYVLITITELITLLVDYYSAGASRQQGLLVSDM